VRVLAGRCARRPLAGAYALEPAIGTKPTGPTTAMDVLAATKRKLALRSGSARIQRAGGQKRAGMGIMRKERERGNNQTILAS
jgi:hypothetical protein